MFKVNEKVVNGITGEIYIVDSIDVYDNVTLLYTTCKKYIPINDVVSFNPIKNSLSNLERKLEILDDELLEYLNNL